MKLLVQNKNMKEVELLNLTKKAAIKEDLMRLADICAEKQIEDIKSEKLKKKGGTNKKNGGKKI